MLLWRMARITKAAAKTIFGDFGTENTFRLLPPNWNPIRESNENLSRPAKKSLQDRFMFLNCNYSKTSNIVVECVCYSTSVDLVGRFSQKQPPDYFGANTKPPFLQTFDFFGTEEKWRRPNNDNDDASPRIASPCSENRLCVRKI